MSRCPNCGSEFATSDRFCARCGRPLAAPITYPPAPPYPYYLPPKKDNTALIVVLVVLLLAVPTILAGILYVMVSGLITSPGNTPRPLGVTLSKSADGTNWTLTFTLVPSGLAPSTTYLGLSTAGGASALPRTAFSGLTGGVVALTSGSVYIEYRGVLPRAVSAGDMVRIGTTLAGSTTGTAGYEVQITSGGNTLFAGVLQ